MSAKVSLAISVGVVLIAGILGAEAAQAQDTAASSLEDQLKTQYKLAKMGSDSSGLVVAEQGAVLVIKTGGIRSYPPGDATVPPNTYKDGTMHAPSALIKKFWNIKGIGQGSDNSRILPLETKVYATKISLDAKNDKVTFNIMECDSCNGVQRPSSYKSAVVFQFTKDYLSKADASQIKDVISLVLGPDTSGQQQQAQTQQQQAPDQSAPAPQTIQLGQTIDQVKAALGQPGKIVDLGQKQIYVYKDLKITFVNGKVADVQ
ncbi:MAG: hypothetical protein AUH86_06145 [Acidobacteria bacterium 13_1_40CM_4_58_4]|nr:MAG: hypothetical protein AUH86_06145 [Acidobacteria bacterium 13_1_40CM_4_58_4]